MKEAYTLLQNEKLKEIYVTSFQNEVGIITLKNLEMALKHKIGDYPVLLITDYYEKKPVGKTLPAKQDIQDRINKYLPRNYFGAISTCSQLAGLKNINIYLVGGLVRDLIRNDSNLDIDITLESNGIEFAKELEQYCESITLKEQHNDFKTAKILFSDDEEDLEIDIASTRKEYYAYPGALPTIKEFACPITDELFRRDYTINAMALNINPYNFALLIDEFEGLADIETKILRVMHSLSYIDDPTRIIRGIKFAVRFGYNFSIATEKLIINCINSGLFDGFCSERLKLELKPALNLNNIKVIEQVIFYKVFKMLDSSIEMNNTQLPLFENLRSTINIFEDYLDPNLVWLIYLAALISQINENKQKSILEKLYLTNNEKLIILEGLQKSILTMENMPPEKPSEIYNFYAGMKNESIIISTFCNSSSVIINNISEYLKNYSKMTINSSGNTLIDLGIKQGPVYSEIFSKLKDLKLDGKIKSAQDEIDFIRKKYL